MDLHDYLRNLSTDALRLITDTIDVARGARMRTRMIHEIRWKLSDRSYLSGMVDRLSVAGRDLLAMIVLSEDVGVSRETLDQRGMLASDQAHKSLLQLMRHGVVGATDGPRGSVRYRMPLECREALVERVYGDLLKQIPQQDGQDLVFPDEGHSIVRDIFSFLCCIHREQVRLTQKRTFRKRTLRGMMRRFEEPEPVPPGSDSLPPRLDGILRYCYERGLIENTGGLVHTAPPWLDWLELSEFNRLTDLTVWWLGPTVARHSCTDMLLELLRRVPENEPFSQSGAFEFIFRYALEPLPTHSARFISSLLDVLRWLGLIRVGVTPSGSREAFGVTGLGRQILNGEESPAEYTPPHLFVQPNYEILIPREFDLKLRFQLERFATPVTTDRMIAYRITEETIYWGLEHGMTSEEILRFLDEHSSAPLAQNLRYFVSDVAERWGEIHFEDLFLLRTRSRELATELRANQRFSGLIRGAVGPTALIVERSDYRRLMEGLRDAGYMPRTTSTTEESVTPRSSGRRRFEPASLEELRRAARAASPPNEEGRPIDLCALL